MKINISAKDYLSYSRNRKKMAYWRTTSQFEVDLILGTETAIEIKGSALVQDKHLKDLQALMEEQILNRYILISLNEGPRSS